MTAVMEFERAHVPEFRVTFGWDNMVGTVRMYDDGWMAFNRQGVWVRNPKKQSGMFPSRVAAGRYLVRFGGQS